MNHNHSLISSIFSSTTIMKAEWVELSAWYGHVPFAFWLIENLQPKTNDHLYSTTPESIAV